MTEAAEMDKINAETRGEKKRGSTTTCDGGESGIVPPPHACGPTTSFGVQARPLLGASPTETSFRRSREEGKCYSRRPRTEPPHHHTQSRTTCSEIQPRCQELSTNRYTFFIKHSLSVDARQRELRLPSDNSALLRWHDFCG